MELDSIRTDDITRISQDTFGNAAKISCIREITASKAHGIVETPPSTRNLLYVVSVENHLRPYVFRFSRVEDDVYEQEARNYSMLAQRTGIRVPTIHRLDTSKRIVPTSYMVMEYLPGKLWQFAAHPQNPQTSQHEKDEIARAVGRYYARVHDVRKDLGDPSAETKQILDSIDFLEEASQRGNVRITASEIDLCRRAVLDEPAFRRDTLWLCLADTEIHVHETDDTWSLAFLCDAEWVEYRHRFFDLTQVLEGAEPWWEMEMPASQMDASEIAALPFFESYDRDGTLDYAELLRLGDFYQLSLWAYVAMSSRAPAKKAWLKNEKEPLIRELVRLVAKQSSPITS